MSKVIVIEQCEECLYCGQIGGTRYCMNDFEYIDDPALSVVELYEHETKMPDWCTLRPLPEKQEYERPGRTPFTDEYVAGWNACLDAITGGNDETPGDD